MTLETPAAERGKVQRWISRQLKGENPEQQTTAIENVSAASRMALASLGPKTRDLVAAGRPDAIAAYEEALELAEQGIELDPYGFAPDTRWQPPAADDA